MAQSALHWPPGFSPAENPIHVVNSLDLAVSPAAAWSKLVKASAWPLWYRNSAAVRIADGQDELSEGVRFSWRTFGIRLQSVVREFAPQERIAWVATAPGVRAYHGWLITPLEGGCRIVTEETQSGVVARGGRLLYPGRMESWHQRWLEGFAE